MRIRRPHTGYGLVWSHVVRRDDLSVVARLLYAVMATYANGDRQLYPSIPALAGNLGVSDRTIQRGLKELEAAGIVMRAYEFTERGAQRASSYELLDDPSPVTQVSPTGVTHTSPGAVTDESPPGGTAVTPGGDTDVTHNKTREHLRGSVAALCDHGRLPAGCPFCPGGRLFHMEEVSDT